jgi:small subunit ribosomal protein S16
MEVAIRLQKAGIKASRGHRNYRIVAISKTKSRDSNHLEILGHYDPDKKPAELKVDHAKLEKWLKVGAQMSDTVKSLVRKSKKDKK